jgi:gas vesicle protein
MKRATGKSNLDIVKDYVEGNRPFIQVGYDPNLNNSKRKENEEWEDAQGNKWIWKNGTKRKVSKLGQIKIDQRCSICNADMKFGNYLDDRFFPKTGKCYDCAISFDSKLKSLGVYADYEKYKIYNSMLSEMKDFKKNITDSIQYLEKNPEEKLQFFNDDGSQEFWTDNTNQIQKVLSDLKNDLKDIEDNISKANEELSKLNYNSEIESKAKQMVLDRLNQ